METKATHDYFRKADGKRQKSMSPEKMATARLDHFAAANPEMHDPKAYDGSAEIAAVSSKTHVTPGAGLEEEPETGVYGRRGEDQVQRLGKPREPNTAPCRRRLRVGFLSAFFFHHSVGLLTQGVITRLDQTRFETTAIFLQPHSTWAYGDHFNSTRGFHGRSGGDDVYTAVREGTENVLDIPAGRYTTKSRLDKIG